MSKNILFALSIYSRCWYVYIRLLFAWKCGFLSLFDFVSVLNLIYTIYPIAQILPNKYYRNCFWSMLQRDNIAVFKFSSKVSKTDGKIELSPKLWWLGSITNSKVVGMLCNKRRKYTVKIYSRYYISIPMYIWTWMCYYYLFTPRNMANIPTLSHFTISPLNL